MILIIDRESTARYCQDGKFRYFACFGTYPECVKVYKTLGHAFVAAKQWNSRVVDIPDNMRVEAGGTVIELIPCPAKEGYVDCVHHDIVKFVLTRPTECDKVCV